MNRTFLHIVLLLTLVAALLVPLLDRVPRAYVDDSWSPMPAYTLAFEGVPRNPGQMGRGGVDTILLEPRLFGSVIGAAVYRIIGFGFVQSRIAAVVFCTLLILVVYALMRRLYAPAAGLAIAAITALDPWIFLSGRTFREEVFLNTLLWTTAWLLLEAQHRRPRLLSFAGGVTAGMACWAHPNAVVFLTAALLAVVVTAGPRRILRARPLWVLGGFVAGIAPYVCFVIVAQYATDVRLADQVGRRAGSFRRPPVEIVATEIRRWTNFLRLPMRAPLALMLLWGVLWGLFRGGKPERTLAIWVVLSALLLPLIQPVPTGRYLVILVPALAALLWRSLPHAAATAPDAWGRVGPNVSSRHISFALTSILLVVYVAMSLAPNAYVLYKHRRADYNRWMARIAEHIPRDARVMGDTMFWTGLHDRAFVSSITPYFAHWRSEADAAAFIEHHRPARLIQASSMYSAVGGVARRPADLRATTFGRACELVAAAVPSEILLEFYDPDFGAVRVWKLEWPAVDSPITIRSGD